MGFVILFAILALVVWMQVRVLHKAGLSGFWVITQLIPIVNIIAIWVFAFARWPGVDDGQIPPGQREKIISAWD